MQSGRGGKFDFDHHFAFSTIFRRDIIIFSQKIYVIFGRRMPCSMYSSLLVERAESTYCRNEQTTVAQPASGPTEGYPSVGKNAKKKLDLRFRFCPIIKLRKLTSRKNYLMNGFGIAQPQRDSDSVDLQRCNLPNF